MNHSIPGLPVHHQILEFTQTHVHRVGDAIQPSHPLSSPSPPAPNPSQHQSFPVSQLKIFKRILLSNKKEQTIDTSRKEHLAKWKRPDSNSHTLDSIHCGKGNALGSAGARGCWKGSGMIHYEGPTGNSAKMEMLGLQHGGATQLHVLHAKSLQSCLTLWNPVDHSLPGSCVHGISQAIPGVACHGLFQGIFLIQGSNTHLNTLAVRFFSILQVPSVEKAMAPHSSALAWKTPWMEEPGGLQSVGSRTVGHNWATSLSLFFFCHFSQKFFCGQTILHRHAFYVNM